MRFLAETLPRPTYQNVSQSDIVGSVSNVGDVSTTAHGYAPQAPGDPTKFLNGNAAYTKSNELAWPIGSVYITVLLTNPAVILGVGTWAPIAIGLTAGHSWQRTA